MSNCPFCFPLLCWFWVSCWIPGPAEQGLAEQGCRLKNRLTVFGPTGLHRPRAPTLERLTDSVQVVQLRPRAPSQGPAGVDRKNGFSDRHPLSRAAFVPHFPCLRRVGASLVVAGGLFGGRVVQVLFDTEFFNTALGGVVSIDGLQMVLSSTNTSLTTPWSSEVLSSDHIWH